MNDRNVAQSAQMAGRLDLQQSLRSGSRDLDGRSRLFTVGSVFCPKRPLWAKPVGRDLFAQWLAVRTNEFPVFDSA